MKNVQYFIEKEKEYKEKHKGFEVYWDNEARGFVPVRYADDFLRNGLITRYAQDKHTSELELAMEKFNLCESEILILMCYFGNMSQYFRDDVYAQFDDIPEVAKEMQKILECIIANAPIHKEQTVYRFLNCHDQNNMEVGDTIEIKHNLTTTIDDWEKDTDSYSITPLPMDKTKARDLYKIYNYCGENQVNFLRGSKFFVVSISLNPQTGRKRFYLKETE